MPVAALAAERVNMKKKRCTPAPQSAHEDPAQGDADGAVGVVEHAHHVHDDDEDRDAPQAVERVEVAAGLPPSPNPLSPLNSSTDALDEASKTAMVNVVHRSVAMSRPAGAARSVLCAAT